MNRMQSVSKLLVILLTGFVFYGCAAAPKVEHSGFLQNFPQFQPGPPDGMDQIYITPGANLRKYNKVMLDEVQFFLKQDAAKQGLQASELKELADTFHRAVFEALGTVYPLVTEPGADVLRIRVAITDIVTSNPAVSGITTVLPVGLAISVGKKAVGGSYSGVGGASMEVEFLDSMTAERVVAAIDTFNGSKMSGFSKLGATKDAFAFWAKRLRVTLDKAHGASN